MRIDRYVHDERLTWSAAGVLMLVAAMHLSGIARLLFAPPQTADAVQQRPRQTRPVPILVDTPTADPVPPDTQVKKYEMGDELLPGVPGPPMPEGAGDDELYADAAPVEETTVFWNLKLVDIRPPL